MDIDFAAQPDDHHAAAAAAAAASTGGHHAADGHDGEDRAPRFYDRAETPLKSIHLTMKLLLFLTRSILPFDSL